jgi:hypothetical protein
LLIAIGEGGFESGELGSFKHFIYKITMFEEAAYN